MSFSFWFMYVYILGNPSALSLQHSKASFHQYVLLSSWSDTKSRLLYSDFSMNDDSFLMSSPKYTEKLFWLRLRPGGSLKQSFSCIFTHMSEIAFPFPFPILLARFIFISPLVRKARNKLWKRRMVLKSLPTSWTAAKQSVLGHCKDDILDLNG